MTRNRGQNKVATLLYCATTIGCLCSPAAAEDSKLELSATAAFTTDYIFRGVSQTRRNPAVQASLDASYGIFYAGIWGSNVDFGGNEFGKEIATLEIDYYGGIAPTWKGITFDIGGYFYTYPGAFDPGGNFDYFELKTGASYTFADSLTVTIANWWTPDYSGETGDGDALELSAAYAFASKLFNFFSPSVSALVGWQWTSIEEFTYWNAGFTLSFMDNWSADIRYWDTNLGNAGCANLSGLRTTATRGSSELLKPRSSASPPSSKDPSHLAGADCARTFSALAVLVRANQLRPFVVKSPVGVLGGLGALP